jgi:hypothetical protein
MRIVLWSSCPHGVRSTPETCSQCLGVTTERVRLDRVKEHNAANDDGRLLGVMTRRARAIAERARLAA